MKLFLCLLCCFLAFLLANPEKTEERCMFKADAGPCNAKITMFAHDPFEAINMVYIMAVDWRTEVCGTAHNNVFHR
ncbi:uncharacterized protein LOC132787828 isoform X3 [Drosophila nasuta]|uniref:uncharacterized protein LOC132787828 isoform X3 n=1 Tax=Drosophila nasuta TaxID=42062 RepID=UPI00295E55BE|nr:uncharacterized protein LOC132787828 isoform X3 [Drosophila nasuta]